MSFAPDLDPNARILAAASRRLFSYGYSALTMDDLARDLGMSKKTLYLHFPGKDAIVGEIIDGFAGDVRSMADAVFADDSLKFTAKLHRFSGEMLLRFAKVNAHVLRDLQRFAPHIYRHIEELRRKTIPHVFGKLLRQGQVDGIVRPDIDPDFAVEFWLPAMQSLMHPDCLDRLELTPAEVFARAINLFFGGLLTPAGRKEYEKLFPN